MREVGVRGTCSGRNFSAAQSEVLISLWKANACDDPIRKTRKTIIIIICPIMSIDLPLAVGSKCD